jgi:hypothetical protein
VAKNITRALSTSHDRDVAAAEAVYAMLAQANVLNEARKNRATQRMVPADPAIPVAAQLFWDTYAAVKRAGGMSNYVYGNGVRITTFDGMVVDGIPAFMVDPRWRPYMEWFFRARNALPPGQSFRGNPIMGAFWATHARFHPIIERWETALGVN